MLHLKNILNNNLMTMNYNLILDTNKKSKWINTCEILVLHHTWWWTFGWNMNFLASNIKQASAHYVVWQAWEVWKIWNDTDILWHAWNSKWNWKTDLNKCSIWIEIVDDWKTFTDIQRDKVDELAIELIKKYGIKKENLVRHKDICVPAWRKVDPDDSLWNTRFKTFEVYKNFLFSKLTIMEAVWFYEEIYKRENPNGWSVIKDINWAINRLVDSNWNLKWKETIYFFATILERTKPKV